MDFDDRSDGEDFDDMAGGAEGFFAGQFDEAVNPDYVQKNDAVIFVINCQQHIFDKLPQEEGSQMNTVLNAMTSFYKTKIISNVHDQVGLVLYNVQKDNNPLKFEGINLKYSLESPSAERIRETPTLANDFANKFGFAQKDTPLHEVLWLCNSEFNNLDKAKFDFRIFLFTADDNPHVDNQQLRDQSTHHFKQLADKDVSVEVFPLQKHQETKFNLRNYFIDVLPVNLDEVNDALLDTSNKIFEIQQRMRQKEFKKRTLNRVLFTIGNDVKMGVKLYCHINKAKRPLAQKLHKDSNKPLKRTVKQLCTETGQVLYNEHIGTYFPLKDEKIRISADEVKKIKAFDASSMKLMGFKPRSKLKLYQNYRTSYFLYPDEQRVKGSSQLCHALITQMLAKNKIAIVRFVPRAGSQVRFCALLPQEESYNENHFQTPPGFNLIYLPFADDIRTLKNKVPQSHMPVSKDLLDIAKMLVTNLDLIDFDCRHFEDPSLQKFFAHLQAHALKEEDPEEPQDLLMPDKQGFEKHQDLLDMFREYLNIEGDNSKNNDNEIQKKTKKEPGVTKKKNVAGGGAKTIKMENKQQKKPAQKRGKKNTKMEEEEEEGNYSDDSHENGVNDYDLDDGFVVADEDGEEDDDYQPKKKNRKNNIKNANGLSQEETNQIRSNEIQQTIMQGEFNNLKMEDLKFYLGQNNLNNKGNKKEDLINRALNHISNA